MESSTELLVKKSIVLRLWKDRCTCLWRERCTCLWRETYLIDFIQNHEICRISTFFVLHDIVIANTLYLVYVRVRAQIK